MCSCYTIYIYRYERGVVLFLSVRAFSDQWKLNRKKESQREKKKANTNKRQKTNINVEKERKKKTK